VLSPKGTPSPSTETEQKRSFQPKGLHGNRRKEMTARDVHGNSCCIPDGNSVHWRTWAIGPRHGRFGLAF
jgi:hypothetical protein